MSGIVSTLSSTKGDHSATTNATTSSKQANKAGFDHLDVNRLFKGKTAEPTTKQVAQKHGMQTLGKVLPARRAGGGSSVTGTPPAGEEILESGEERKGNPEPVGNFQDPNQGWIGQQSQGSHLLAQPPPRHPIPNQIQPLLDQKWNGGRPDGNFPGSRFAQEFPSLDAAVADGGKAQSNASSSTHRPQTKSQDNQYGPGPILRPQTEGSWTLGGSGGKRPSPPTQQLNFPADRPTMGSGPGPLPGQMPIGQIPPPLGAYQPTLRPNQQQPNIPYGKGGGSGFYPGGGNPALRFGMPIPHDAPPPGQGGEVPPPLRRAPPPPRPGSHFTSKPIIRQEELERMDEIGTHEGDWASANDDVDYNKKINFSDEDEHANKGTSMPSHPQATTQAGKRVGSERQGPRFLHREEEDRGRPQQVREVEDDWRQRRGEKDKERDHTQRGRDDDWRSGPIRPVAEDFRNKKGAPVPPLLQQRDNRPQDFPNSNVPPRFLRRNTQPQPQPQSSTGQREVSSTNTTNGGKDSVSHPPYKILERKRGESESSRESRDSKDKRQTPLEPPTRVTESEVKDDFRKRDTTPPTLLPIPKDSEKIEKRTTCSWAEEMDEDESLHAIAEMRKPHVKEVTPALKKEERRDRIESKRIIKQTKVADMQTLTKEESPPKTSVVKKDSNTTGQLSAQQSSEHQADSVKTKPGSAWDVEKCPPRTEEPVTKEASSLPSEPQQKKSPDNRDSQQAAEKPLVEEAGAKKEIFDGQVRNVDATFEKEEAEDKKGKAHPPQRKTSKESKHGVVKQEFPGDSAKDDGKKFHQQQQHQPPSTQQKFQDHNSYQKEQRGSGDGKKEDKRNQSSNKHPNKPPPETKHSGNKIEEVKGKAPVSEEGRRQGSGWNERNEKQQRDRRGGGRQQQHKDEEEPVPKDVTTKTDNNRRPEVDSGGEFRRGGAGNKSPSGTKRNASSHSHGGGRGGGTSRLQGYGPPSDRSPFSTSTNKEPEEERKEKEKKDMNPHSTRLSIPLPTSGPVPLMALGEISPPDLPLRNRHDYGRPPRFQRSFPPSQRDRERVQKSQPNNTKPSGKGMRKGDNDEQDSSSRWSKNSKPQSEESSNTTGSGVEGEKAKEAVHQPQPQTQATPIPPTTTEPLAELGVVPTMVFENTKLKMSEPQQQPGKSLPTLLQSQQLLKADERNSYSPSGGLGVGPEKKLDQGLDLNVQGALPFPKESSPVKLDFGTGFGEEREPKSGPLFHQQTTRSYTHVHQEEYRSGRRISPLQTSDLPESLQGLRSLWDTPPLSEGAQDSSPLPTFGQEGDGGLNYSRQADKQDHTQPYHLAQMQRSLGNMGQPQGTNGFQVSQVPASVSVIAKPVSSGSPTGLNRQQHPQMKTIQQQQQMSLESQQQQQQQQSHGPMSFSPFGYGANAFGPIGGVPSPPSLYAQKSQLYQPFNPHDSAHVLSGAGRSHSQYGNYTNMGGGGGNPYGSSLFLQPYENFGPYATHSGPPQPPASLQLQSNNRISPGLPPTSATGHPLPSPGMMNSTSAPPGNNAFKTVQVRNPTSHTHPSLLHQNNQQPFSQMTHHLPHPHLTPIGPQKTPYSQQPLQPQTQPQLYIPFEPNPQSMMNLGGNYSLRTGGGPPPSGTPPMQGLSSYYATGTGVNQGYPQQQNPQGGSLPMQVPPSTPHYGIQFQPPYNNSQVQGPNPSVLGNSLTRAQHGNRK